MKCAAAIFVTVTMLFIGCARQKPAAHIPASQPVIVSRAQLPLDEIDPPPSRMNAATTAEDLPSPPLEAIELFAKARRAIADNQPFTAIQLLEKAIDLDPVSFELHMSLARAYAATNNQAERVAAALLAAVKLEPDSLEALCELGKAQFASTQYHEAMQSLRLARMTSSYKSDDDRAALVDYYLARSLQEQGYDRAAIDMYCGFVDRVKYARPSVRVYPELSFFERHPEGIFNQIGKLYERLGNREQALQYFHMVAERSPDDFAAQAQVVKSLLDLDRDDAAMQQARELLSKFQASTDSIALLRLVAQTTKNEAAVVNELRSLLVTDPKNRAALFALSEMLQEAGKREDARQVLTNVLTLDPGAIDIIRRVFNAEVAQGDSSAGAKFLIERMTASPAAFSSISELWERLLNDPELSPLTIAALLELELPSADEGARQFWVSQMALMSNRTALARSAMEKSVRSSPPFAPAFRARVNQIFSRTDLSAQQRMNECDVLADLARRNGSDSIALQVEAQAFIAQDQAPAAVEKLSAALKGDADSPELSLNYANTLRASGQLDKAEQQLWKIVSDFPTFQGGYQSLINLYIEKNNGQQAQRVLTMWLSADPEGSQAKLYEAAMYRLAQQMAASEGILMELLRREPWNSDVLSNVRGFFQTQNKPDEAIVKLEDARTRNPKNRLILNQLIELYGSRQRTADASRAVDAYVQAVGENPKLLYYAAPAYREIGQPEQSDQILARVLQLDPRHSGANNDLGYNWADQNKHLEQAEAMLRIAVEQEPENESFLDSMGWVLYKRGNYTEARNYLQRAMPPGNPPDPQTLDHIGDVAYRLNDTAGAKNYWSGARDQLAAILKQNSQRKDLLNLQLALQNKLRQLEQGVAVSVSPVVENVTPVNQASK